MDSLLRNAVLMSVWWVGVLAVAFEMEPGANGWRLGTVHVLEQ